MQPSDNEYEGSNTNLSYSLENIINKKSKNNFLVGRLIEKDKFLGSDATGMFYMENLKTETDYFGFKTENIIGDSLYFKSSYTVGRSALNYSYSPFSKRLIRYYF